MTVALRPGVLVTSQQAPQPRGTGVQTGTWFVVGTAEKGSLTGAQLIRNMNEFSLYYGSRQTYSILWDALETFFREGGTQAYVARVAGPSAVAASVTLNDSGATPSIKVSAKNPGIWGNSLRSAVVSATGGYQLVISHSSLGVLETSPILATQADAKTWSIKSIWVTVTIPGGAGTNPPAVVAATALTSGVDDNTSGVTDTVRNAGLNLFTADLGTGQVSIPGSTTSSNRTALLAHAVANNRQAYLDSTDTPTTATLLTEATGLQGNEYGALFGPWLLVPGLAQTPTNPRVVPPTALAAALVARNDPVTGVNKAAAGPNRGVANYVLGLTQPGFSNTDYDALNTAGLNMIRTTGGVTMLFGTARSLRSARSGTGYPTSGCACRSPRRAPTFCWGHSSTSSTARE